MLQSTSQSPECHNGAAYSVIGCKTTFQKVISSSNSKPNAFNLLIIGRGGAIAKWGYYRTAGANHKHMKNL